MSSEHDAITLTEDEERRFAELFNGPDRLTLTEGWQDTLREAVRDARESGDGDMFQVKLRELEGLVASVRPYRVAEARQRSPRRCWIGSCRPALALPSCPIAASA